MAKNKNSTGVLVAVFAILLAATTITASMYETTTTTTVETTRSENPSSECRQQIERQQVNACQRYLTESSRIPPAAVEEESSWREEFPRCCEQLEKVEEKCRCEVVKMAVEKQRQQGGGGGQELEGQERQEMLRTATTLPALCRMGPQHCQIQSDVAAWF